MVVLTLLRPLLWLLALVGLAAVGLVVMLAVPLTPPPPLASIHTGAVAIGDADRPALRHMQARDGSWLAYRLYPAANAATDQLAVLVHGSSASSAAMNAIALALARANVAAVAIDARGHGASGTRGDIGYAGQLDDDMADLLAALKAEFPAARLSLIGHSSGGGFSLRLASLPVGRAFDRVVLLAPYLGYTAPTNRASEGRSLWAAPDLPRIFALLALRRLGVAWLEAMPVIGFAVAPDEIPYVTPRYSFRLLMNFGPPQDWQGAFAAVPAPIEVIVGAEDELMDAAKYPAALAAFPRVHVTTLPGVDHMGVVHQPAALSAIVAAVAAVGS